MVQIDTILESLVLGCKRTDMLPNDVTYSTVLLDQEGDHSDVSPPVIEFSVEDIARDESRNTERVGVETDDQGKEIGFVYSQWFDAVVQAEVITVSGTQYNHRDLEQDLRDALYVYDKHGVDEQPPDPADTSEPLRDICGLSITDTTPNHDFSMSPSVRSRRTTLDIWFKHTVASSDLGITYGRVKDVDITIDTVTPDDV